MKYTVNLLRARKSAEELEQIRTDAFNKELHRGRVTSLAATLIMLADQAVPSLQWGTIEKPTLFPGLITSFKQQAELPQDYDVKRLGLSIWRNSRSSAQFKLGYDVPPLDVRNDDYEYIAAFDAANSGYIPTSRTGYVRSETGLAIQQPEDQKIVPVEFESDEYKFIYHAAALFMPKVRELVEL